MPFLSILMNHTFLIYLYYTNSYIFQWLSHVHMLIKILVNEINYDCTYCKKTKNKTNLSFALAVPQKIHPLLLTGGISMKIWLWSTLCPEISSCSSTRSWGRTRWPRHQLHWKQLKLATWKPDPHALPLHHLCPYLLINKESFCACQVPEIVSISQLYCK